MNLRFALPLLACSPGISQVAAQTSSTLAPEAFTSPSTVIHSGSFGPSPTFSASAIGQFSDDGILDAALLVDEVAQVIMNPCTWELAVPIPTAGVRDLARWQNPQGGVDGLVTVGEDGVLLWTWCEGLPRGFRSTQVGSNWEDPQLISITRADSTYGYSLASIWDASTGNIRCFLILELGSSSCHPPAVVPMGTPIAASNVQALELCDLLGAGWPGVAIVDNSGLSFWDFSGVWNLQLEVDASTDSSQLVHLNDTEAGNPSGLAWFRQPAGGGDHEVVYIDSMVPSSPLQVHFAPSSVARGNFQNDDDLILGLSDGSARVLLSSCSPIGSQILEGLGCTRSLGAQTALPWEHQTAPAFGDFDLDTFDDALLFDQNSGSVALHHRMPPVAAESAIRPIQQVDSQVWRKVPSNELVLDFDASGLDVRGAAQLQFIVWRWEDHTIAEIAPGSVADEIHPFPSSGNLQVSIPLDFEQDPPALALEVRALSMAGDVVDAETYGVAWSCSIYSYFIDVAGYTPVGDPPCNNGQPIIPPIHGDPIGGLVELPRLPRFEGSSLPFVIRPQ